VGRHKCNLQRNITGNKISKRWFFFIAYFCRFYG
jgi:hypothetical protein